MNRPLRQFPATLKLLAVLVLLVRAFVPSGWMPVADANGIRIAICSGSGPMELVLSKDGTLKKDTGQQKAPRDPCPWGLGSAISADLPVPAALPDPPQALPDEFVRAIAFAARPFPRGLRPPARAPPRFA